MKKAIKSYFKYGEHCGVAKQMEGKVVDAEQDKHGHWHFKVGDEKGLQATMHFTTNNHIFKERQVYDMG